MKNYKKGLVAFAAVLVVAFAAIGAYAYFTSSGSGSGTATVGSTTNTISVASVTTGDLYPLNSAPAANTTISATNNGDGNFFVHQLLLDTSFGGGSGVTNDQEPDCDSSWFQVDGLPVTIDGAIAPGDTYPVPGTPITVWLVDDGITNQDDCQGATVTVHYLSN